jgi:transcriptional regulator with XRE-family HTH domain
VRTAILWEGNALNTHAIGSVLRSRQDAAGLSTSEVAERAGCSVPQVEQVLGGNPQAPLALVVAVCEALGYALVAVPRPAEGAVAAGPQVTEPQVETVVSAALRSIQRPVTFGMLAGRAQVAPDFDAALPQQVQDWFEYWEAEEDMSVAVSAAEAQEQRREARRLALHQAAVRVLRLHPERCERALRTLERWVARGLPDAQLAQEWRGILERRDWDVLLEESERGRRLRKGSPMGCVVDREERVAIIQTFARVRRES